MKYQMRQKFLFALRGILVAIKEETYLKVHLEASLVVICCSYYFGLSSADWSMNLFAIRFSNRSGIDQFCH